MTSPAEAAPPTPSIHAARVAALHADRDLARLEGITGALSRAIGSYRTSVQHEDPELAALALQRATILQARVSLALAVSPIQSSPALSGDIAEFHVDRPQASPSASSGTGLVGPVPLPSFSGAQP